MTDQLSTITAPAPDQRVDDLQALMTSIEETLEEVRQSHSTVRRDPETREGREDRDIEVRQRIHYLDELVSDLFTLMRNWHELPDRPDLTRSSPGEPDGLAIVVGHTAKAQGATGQAPPFPGSSWQERHEYTWNKHLAELMTKHAAERGIRAAVFYRDKGGVPVAYREVEAWNPECTVELHFNAATPSAQGTEVIYGGDDADGSREWSQALQDEMVALYARQGRHDRKIKHHRTTGRGGASLEKVHPSAIIEPFFGSNVDDCALAMQHKEGLALALLRAFAKYSERPWIDDLPGQQPAPVPQPPPAVQPVPPAVAAAPPPPPTVPVPAGLPAAPAAPAPAPAPASATVAVVTPPLPVPSIPVPSAPAAPRPADAAAVVSSVASTIAAIESPSAPAPNKPDKYADIFWRLALRYGEMDVEFPHLRGVTLAQWALECGYGNSKLAQEHLNFAGMKWREVMKPYSSPVSYEAHDGRTDYCKFPTLDMFIRGYWARLDLVSAYDGWRDNTDTPEDFIAHIAETWAPKQDYQNKVMKLYRQLQADGAIPFEQRPMA